MPTTGARAPTSCHATTLPQKCLARPAAGPRRTCASPPRSTACVRCATAAGLPLRWQSAARAQSATKQQAAMQCAIQVHASCYKDVLCSSCTTGLADLVRPHVCRSSWTHRPGGAALSLVCQIPTHSTFNQAVLNHVLQCIECSQLSKLP